MFTFVVKLSYIFRAFIEIISQFNTFESFVLPLKNDFEFNNKQRDKIQ